ncbi:MAG: glycosyltransferase family 4 protein [Bacteroidia bacterium]|nr:glycosyltransferase family 4 protein [Bacteroidia bacterium]
MPLHRVALITDGIWPYVLGGMQKHSYYLCKYLASQKVEVHLFHFNQSNYDISKLEFFSDEERKYIHSNVLVFPKSLPFPGHYLYNSYRYSKCIYALIKDKISSFDYIYTKGFSGWYLINAKHKNVVGFPKIGVKFHGYEMFQVPPDFKTKLQHILLLRKPVRSISTKADHVFSYGGKITDIILSIGINRSKIIELPSGVEASVLVKEIKPTQKPLKFLFLGRYERRKGVQELNATLQNTNESDFEFHFIGPIPEEYKIKLSQVVYHGEIRDKKQLNELIRSCDVLVCPSWSEGMPNVILEAMANGLSVIATDVGATAVLVNEQNGWLLKSPAPAEIERSLQKVLHSSLLEIDRKKNNALLLIKERFTWENLISELVKKIS